MTIYTRRWTTRLGEQKTAYRVQVTTPAGERIQRQFPTKREALHFEKNPSLWVQETASREQFALVAEDWITWVSAGSNGGFALEPATVRMYRGFLDNHILPAFGAKTWRQIDRRAVEAFRDDLLSVVSRSTGKRILGALRGICAYAEDMGYVTASPAAKVMIKGAGGRHASAKRLDIHSKEEMARILKACADRADDPRWKRNQAMINILVYAGLRSSELRGLPVDAFTGGALEIRQRADETGQIGPPKTKSGYRTIPLPAPVIEILDKWVEDVPKRGLMFPTKNATAWLHQNFVKRVWDPVQALAEVSRKNLHAARHFYASRLIEMNVGRLELRELMGHSSVEFTMQTYGHLFKDKETDAARRRLVNSLVLEE